MSPLPARPFGAAATPVSAIGFGAWAIGGSWGKVEDATSAAAPDRALEKGITFYDTADVYGDGRSEDLAGRVGLAKQRRVSIIARVPLASGLLTGKITRESTFAADDHRNFNLKGQAFDVGETFSGVPLDAGLAAVEELRPLVPKGTTMAQFALR